MIGHICSPVLYTNIRLMYLPSAFWTYRLCKWVPDLSITILHIKIAIPQVMESAVVKVNNTQIYLIEMAEKLNKLSHAYKEVTNGWCHKWGFHSQNAAKMFFSEYENSKLQKIKFAFNIYYGYALVKKYKMREAAGKPFVLRLAELASAAATILKSDLQPRCGLGLRVEALAKDVVSWAHQLIVAHSRGTEMKMIPYQVVDRRVTVFWYMYL